jgi:photosystem II stability/assembly factor-like uncharacterized protein
MKRQQKSIWSSLMAFAAVSVLYGTAAVASAQQIVPRIDGIYIDSKVNAEVNRAIFLRPDSFGESALIVGTNKGNAMFSKLKADDLLFKQPVFRNFSMPQPSGALVRDINFVRDNKGYMLKSDGIYFSDGRTEEWRQIMSVNDLPPRPVAVAELWSMSFVTDLGVYLKNTNDRSIDQELLLCTDDISRPEPRWNTPYTPKDRTTEQIQFTNIYFDKDENGWLVGTDGAAGVVWYSKDGGREWTEQPVNIESPLLSVNGEGNKVVGVGFNGTVFGKGFGGRKTNEAISVSLGIKVDDWVEVKGKLLAGIQGLGKVTARVEKVRPNGMLKLKIIDVNPPDLRDLVENIIERTDISPREVVKIERNENSSNENNNNNNRSNSTNSSWERLNVSQVLRNPTVSLRSVKFSGNGQNGFIVGDKGTILYTDDGGASWKSLTSSLPAQQSQLNLVDFYAVYIDKKHCWIAGSKGTVVRVRYIN